MKASADLAKRILTQIDREEHRKFVIKAAAFGAALAGSLATIAWETMNVAEGLTHSGFFSFVSLLFSDFSLAMSNFSDYIFSLAASFPIFAAAALLAGIFVAIVSAGAFLREIGLMRRRTFHSLT